jgi:hypothetical protein
VPSALRRSLRPGEDVERGSADVQDLTLSDGRTVWMQVAALVDEWGEELVGENGLSSVGAVSARRSRARWARRAG